MSGLVFFRLGLGQQWDHPAYGNIWKDQALGNHYYFSCFLGWRLLVTKLLFGPTQQRPTKTTADQNMIGPAPKFWPHNVWGLRSGQLKHNPWTPLQTLYKNTITIVCRITHISFIPGLFFTGCAWYHSENYIRKISTNYTPNFSSACYCLI